MKKKMNQKIRKIKINDKKWRNLIILLAIIIIAVIVVAIGLAWGIKHRLSKEVIVTQDTTDVKEIQWFDEQYTQVIDMSEIIQKNLNNEIKEVIETKIVELEYETEYQNNPNLPKGKVQVLQQGQDGKQELIIKKQYEGKKVVSDEQIGRRIVTNTINRIVEVGTSNYYDNYKIKIGDTVYATPYELDLKSKPKKGAEVSVKINQDSKLEIEKQKGNWYYVKYNNYYGWVEADCVTYIIPNNFIYNSKGESKEYSKKELISRLSKNMQLNKPSGLTLEQFEKLFADESKDKNGVFKQNAKYFYYIEQSYGINGVFVAAIGVHESAWGTSRIAKDKKNLFGYGAYDMNAYASAYEYNGYAAGIDMIARVLIKNYLNPKGTSIYNGEVATGKYYNGATLTGVNKKYATDKKWADGVYSWMKYLYNKL